MRERMPRLPRSGSRPSRQLALEAISFEIRPGELAALVGPSGAGKTTITYLLPRLYDPTGGRICLDGHDLRDVTQVSLARPSVWSPRNPISSTTP